MFISMEEKLSFNLMLPLKQISLRRAAIVLWSGSDVLASIQKFQETVEYGGHQEKWVDTVECKVLEKISELQLPEELIKEMIQILKPIGLEILRWKTFHEAYLSPSKYTYPCEYFNVPVLEKLCWTTVGTIDYRRTAEDLIRYNVVKIVKRYQLASLYCLDQYIPQIWKELPKENKKDFYNAKDFSHITLPVLQFYWPYILKKEEDKLKFMHGNSSNQSFNLQVFTFESFSGNEAAVKYYFQKLSPVEKEDNLVKMAVHALESRIMGFDRYPLRFPKENVSAVVIYLISVMTPEQQVRLFKLKPAGVLGCFLDWPWQDVFLDVADSMWNWMQCDTKNYDLLLDFMEASSDYYLPTMYQKFFLRSPSDFRKHFVDRECRLGTFFKTLFSVQDIDTMTLILKNVDAADRVRLALSNHMFKQFYDIILKDRGHLVEMFLQDIGLTEMDKGKLKKAFWRFLKRQYKEINLDAPKWRRFFEFLDKPKSNDQSKRKLTDKALFEFKKCSKK